MLRLPASNELPTSQLFMLNSTFIVIHFCKNKNKKSVDNSKKIKKIIFIFYFYKEIFSHHTIKRKIIFI